MKKLLCTTLIICLGQLLVAQTTSDIVKAAFDNFIQIPEESVYLHLNKSVLLQGEDLGFAAYVFNHKEQKPFEVVKNLYCQLLDEKGNIIKEKLLLLEQGKVFHTFALDSLTPPGNYTIKAFTNWMKNFKSPHFFEAPILILEENGKQQTISRNTATSINIFPEGGYLVKDVSSTVTFSIDESMRGDSNYAELFVNEKQLGNVSLDRQGIGRFTLDPKQVNSYKIKLEKSSVFLTLNLPKIRNTGIVLSVNQHGEKVNIELRTNEETLNSKKDNELILLVNGSQKLNIYNILLRNLKEIISLDLSEFNSGMNQITLMTTDKQVISKRLIFNYNDFEIIKSSQVNLSRVLDTITSQIAFNDIKEAALSVSVLPIETISLDKAQSISASFKLYPYLYDTVKNPLYYLSDVNERKKYEMDNLLLCLGWEMYNWDFIFQEEKFFKNEFENGITAIANINDSKSKDFSVLFNRNSKTTLISLEKDDNSFLLESFFPTEGENLRISEISKKGVAKNTGMYVRFFPSQIPSLRNSRNPKPINISESSDGMLVNPLIKRAIKLDTVQLKIETAKEKRDRILVSKARGQMDIFSDWDR